MIGGVRFVLIFILQHKLKIEILNPKIWTLNPKP
jgi:hypothetical protein